MADAIQAAWRAVRDASGPRRLRFRADLSLGIITFSWRADGLVRMPDDEPVGPEARGDVQVPVGRLVCLHVVRWWDLAPLASLPPDGLDRLEVHHAPGRENEAALDQQVVHLAGLTGLQELSISTLVTDAALAHLARLTNLRRLELGVGAGVSGAGLRHLTALRRLESLRLRGTGVTDAVLAQLAGLPVEQLYYLPAAVTDAGLAPLAGLAGLQWLGLSGTGVTDGGLAHLAGLTRLQVLHLSHTGVTDGGLAHLAGLTSLAYLLLNGTAITDAGLGDLVRLPGLRHVSLESTAVTSDGVAALRAARPELVVRC
jgi:hypothetical protein